MVSTCGFYRIKGGFNISDEDKRYMEACKVVVSTCAFGGGDNLYEPIGMLDASLKKVIYVVWESIVNATLEAVDLCRCVKRGCFLH